MDEIPHTGNGFPWPIVDVDSDPSSDDYGNYPAGFTYGKLFELYWRAKTVKFQTTGSVSVPANSFGDDFVTVDLEADMPSGDFSIGDDGITRVKSRGTNNVRSPQECMSPASWSFVFQKVIKDIPGQTIKIVGDTVPKDSVNPDPSAYPQFSGLIWKDDSDDGEGHVTGHFEWPNCPIRVQAWAQVSFEMFDSTIESNDTFPSGLKKLYPAVKRYNGLYYPFMRFGVSLQWVEAMVSASDLGFPTTYSPIDIMEGGTATIASIQPPPDEITSTFEASVFGQTATAYQTGVGGGDITGMDSLAIDIKDWWPFGGKWDTSSGAYVP